ncbi:hypothetical protein H1S01_19550 [Heliobacterium chlorum]|uniref:Uncharacterized protein n=1 Tax=Heliobacterium chlorum TaxID=2698 RepID=A0ABR7T8N1_HELCL|nr:CBO0543 family protein [Heliobacterium chlorum]MBC9786642.1 hypothetical protein [Heliobacterium chlorum]
MIDKVIEHVINDSVIISQMNSEYITLWKENVFLTSRWWITVALLILPWIIWLTFRKRESTHRLLYAGFWVYLISSILDAAGVAFGLWCYVVTPLPYLHSFFLPWDGSVLPVVVMLMIQIKPKLPSYLKAAIFALGSSFIAEPLAIWVKIYQPLTWRHYYGVPIYFVIYLLAHWMSKRKEFKRIQE